MTFAELGLSEQLLQAIESAGYTEPTPIQSAAIPHALAGRDVLGVAQTGTGKTASFTLPMIEMLSRGRAKARMPRSLILEPTRELAAQVAENFDKYGKNHKLTKALLIGGVSFGDQDRLLTQGVDVLIATPGRLLDHFERGKLLLSGCQILVVDEADRMLDMGFIPDIERIFKLTPFTRQTLFFSATMPPEIQRLTQQFLHNPERVEVARPASTSASVTQKLVRIGSNDPSAKRAALRAAIDGSNVRTAIVFCNRKTEVDVVAKSLARHGYKAAPIHGDLPQPVRTATLAKFKNGEINILVASDVAARGLDIHDVSHVLNYNVPRHADDYVHRIGRTARAGRDGEAITIVSPEDRKSIAAVEALIRQTIPDAGGVELPPAPPARAEGDAPPPARDADRPRRGRRSRRGKGGNGGNGESRNAKPPENPTASTEPAAPSSAPAKPTASAKPPRNDARNNSRNEGRNEGRNDASRRGHEPREGGGAKEVGLGEHTPAFLLRAAPVDKQP
jgi:superfamily II DNA/RNA helicase